MKSGFVRLFLAILLVTAFVGCSSDDEKTIDLSGNWTFTFTGGYSDDPSPWKIIQAGTDITINYDVPGVTMVFLGTCDPSAGTFVATFAAQNQTLSGVSADGAAIDGTWTTSTDSGTFVGVRR